MTTLNTERLDIRNFRPGDWEALQAIIVEYQASEVAAYDHQWPTSPEEIRGVAEWFASGDSFLAVCLKAAERFIGFVALNEEPNEERRQFNLGYIFDSQYHGKGYATEACRAAIAHAFGTLDADQVVTGTAAANVRSCRLLERLGFRKTAEGKGSFRNADDGKPLEFLGYTYALSKDEWQAAQRARAVPQ